MYGEFTETLTATGRIEIVGLMVGAFVVLTLLFAVADWRDRHR
jgi:hypothetical protein